MSVRIYKILMYLILKTRLRKIYLCQVGLVAAARARPIIILYYQKLCYLLDTIDHQASLLFLYLNEGNHVQCKYYWIPTEIGVLCTVYSKVCTPQVKAWQTAEKDNERVIICDDL